MTSIDFVAEMAWKSTVLAVAVLALLAIMRRHDPSHRAAVGGLGIAVLILLPVIVIAATMLPVPAIELPTPVAARAVPATTDAGVSLFPLAVPEAASSAIAEPQVAAVEPETVVAAIWAAGALFVLLRLAIGLLTLRRWTQAAEPVRSRKWAATLRNCGAPDGTRLLVSDVASAPLSWGWRSPVILVDRDLLARAQDAEAIIAHESAHLRRLDWPRLLAARFAVALFWFNPLVWLLERRHLQDVEEAADAMATNRVEPAQYAQILLNVARGRGAPLGANHMACGTLSKRIQSVLTKRASSPREQMWRSGALAGVALIAAPVALAQFVAPAASAFAAVAEPNEVTRPGAVFPAPVAATAPVAVTAPTPITAPAPVTAAVAVVQAAPATAPRPIVDQQELDRIMKEAEQARAHAEIATRDAEQVVARARAEAAVALASAKQDMLRGAEDMEQGAIDMRKGAAEMRDEARKLRDPAYRAEQIRKAAARGDRVPTDQELIDAIPKMEEGARKMDAGVEKMRDGARRMREQARRS